MQTTVSHSTNARRRTALVLSAIALLAFVGVIWIGLAADRTKIVGISAFGFVAMLGGVSVSRLGQFQTPSQQVWAYGLASGALLASAAALLAPKAITQHPEYGGFAIAFGYLLGYAGHELGHLLTHYELPINATTAELSVHALAAGSIMGVVYGSLPSLTPLFGYGIVAHKFPAGFSGAEAVEQSGLPTVVMVVPAVAVGIAAIPLSILTPDLSSIVKAVFYGVSTGVFAHVAIDMLPECTHGDASSGHGSVKCSRDADRLRQTAVVSTILGAAAIFAMWQGIAAL